MILILEQRDFLGHWSIHPMTFISSSFIRNKSFFFSNSYNYFYLILCNMQFKLWENCFFFKLDPLKCGKGKTMPNSNSQRNMKHTFHVVFKNNYFILLVYFEENYLLFNNVKYTKDCINVVFPFHSFMGTSEQTD